jgi:16S rRNA (guanine(527)-N(7))-methyltransferase RsmG
VTPNGFAGDPLDELVAAIPILAGRPATGEDRHRFARYLELLLEWNRVHDLTGLKDARGIVHGLFVDSLLFLPQLPARPLRLIDIGSGAGIPGLPLHLIDPRIEATLVEARQKRVSFLRTVRRELALESLRLIDARAEDAIREDRELEGRYDVAVARAVTPTGPFLAMCRRWLRPGGRIIISGPPPSRALPRAPTGMRWIRAPYPKIRIERAFLVNTEEA